MSHFSLCFIDRFYLRLHVTFSCLFMCAVNVSIEHYVCYITVFSSTLPHKSCLFCNPRLGAHLFSTTGLPHSATPSPVSWFGNCSQAEWMCGLPQGFPSLNNHSPRLPVFQSPKWLSPISSSFVVVYGRRTSPMPITLSRSETEFSGNQFGVLSNSLYVIISPNHSFFERKNVWGFSSLIYETKQLDSFGMTSIHFFRRWFGVYIKHSINPWLADSKCLSPKDMCPKREYLTVMWGPLHMC